MIFQQLGVVDRFALCLAAALLLQIPSTAGAQEGSSGGSEQQAPRPKVVVSEASMRALGEKALFLGRIEAKEKVELRARITGFLRKVTFEDGDLVKEGELLFEIEREPFEATVAMRKAQLASAEARLRNAAVNLKRQQDLNARNATSQAAVDQAIAENDMAEAAKQEAEAALQESEIDLSYTLIHSPIDGRIGKNVYDEGNLVDPDAGVLAVVVLDDPAQAYFEVTQRQLIEARERIGDRPLTVTAQLANGEDYPHKGRIDFFDVTVNPRTDGQLVRAVFDNPDRILTDGQTTRIRIEEETPQQVLSIPLDAVSSAQTGSFVLIINSEEKVERRSVRLGPQDAGFVTVQDGLAEGDRVIVQGQLRVREGVPVEVVAGEDASGQDS